MLDEKPVVINGNALAPSHKSWKTYLGWAGFIITLGILLEQIITHGQSLDSYFIPILLNGRFLEFLKSNDPLYNVMFKYTHTLEMLNAFIMVGYSLFILFCLALRKRFVPRHLVIIMTYAAAFNVVTMILLNMQTTALKATLNINNAVTLIYLAIDIVLVLFYATFKPFKTLFHR